jgi:hypothetical protein
MNNAQYQPYFDTFAPLAKQKLDQLGQLLVSRFGWELTPIEPVDHDVERGFGFAVVDDPLLFVELLLKDGDEHGYEGVSLMLSCSDRPAGSVWAPGNYTPSVGTLDSGELVRRLSDFDGSSICEAIHQEWVDVQVDRQSNPQNYA